MLEYCVFVGDDFESFITTTDMLLVVQCDNSVYVWPSPLCRARGAYPPRGQGQSVNGPIVHKRSTWPEEDDGDLCGMKIMVEMRRDCETHAHTERDDQPITITITFTPTYPRR